MSVLGLLFCTVSALGAAPHPLAAAKITSLTNKSVEYTVSSYHYFAISRGDVRAIIVDNHAVDAPELPGHRAGYNGVASLKHARHDHNLFVPRYAGLNFEHIHDGTLEVHKERYEPRTSPMQLRVVDQHTVELYQPPTPNWKLESCGRYHILPDGTLQYTFECIPRADVFHHGYMGLFWASYIDQPADRAIYFRGHAKDGGGPTDWIRAYSPQHGIDSTHPPSGPLPQLTIDPSFSLTLVNHPSRWVYTEPWYYGVSHQMALAFIFRAHDRIWFAQSPTGGGKTNPAWDFQWFITDYKVDQAYGFVMRAAYVPFETREQIASVAGRHVQDLRGTD